jgi:hypothetical protein
VFSPKLNANIQSGAITFGVPIRLAPRALDNMIFFRGASTAVFILHRN